MALNWTKPLRVADTHEPIYYLTFQWSDGDPTPYICANYQREYNDCVMSVDPEGNGKEGRIENVPEAP